MSLGEKRRRIFEITPMRKRPLVARGKRVRTLCCFILSVVLNLCCLTRPCFADAENVEISPVDLALLRAVRDNDPNAIQVALQAGGTLNPSESMFAPANVAIMYDRMEALAFLLDKGANVDDAFFAAVAFAKVDALELVAKRAKPSEELRTRLWVLVPDASFRGFLGHWRQYFASLIDSTLLPRSEQPWPRPEFVESSNAPEIKLLNALLVIAGPLDENTAQEFRAAAVKNGEVLLSDWIEAHVDTLPPLPIAQLAQQTISLGNSAGLEALVARGFSMKDLPDGGYSAVASLADFGDAAMMQLAIDLGARLNPITPEEPRSPISVSAGSGFSHLIDMLVTAGADPDLPSGNSWPLREAVRSGENKATAQLLAAGAKADRLDRNGATAVHFLADDNYFNFGRRHIGPGHIQAMQSLVGAGLDPNAVDDNGDSIMASLLGKVDVAVLATLRDLGGLLDSSCYRRIIWLRNPDEWDWFFRIAGGNVNQQVEPFRYDDEVTLLEAAVGRSNYELGAYVLDAGAALPAHPASVLQEAISGYQSGLAVLKLLLARGVDPNVRLPNTHVPLSHALFRGNHDALLALLDSGGDPNIAGKDGSLLHDLIREELREPSKFQWNSAQQRAVALLVSRGLNLATADSHDQTVFQLAESSHELSNALESAVALASSSERLPLHDAVRTGSVAAVSEALSKGAPINAKDSLGRSALNLSLAIGSVPIARLLLRHGAEVNVSAAIPGMSTDLSYFEDKRFRDLLLMRILADQLVTRVEDSSAELKLIEQSRSFTPADVAWSFSCDDIQCPPQDVRPLTGNATSHWTLIESTSSKSPGRGEFGIRRNRIEQIVVEKCDCINDYLIAYTWRLVNQAQFTLRGKGSISSCKFSYTQPSHCDPAITIAMPRWSDGQIDLVQDTDVANKKTLEARIKPGEQLALDRSLGEIRYELPAVQARFPRLDVVVQLPPEIAAAAIGDPSSENRARSYVALKKWKGLKSEALHAGTLEKLLYAKRLDVAGRTQSARMLEANYPLVVKQLLLTRASDIARLKKSIATFRGLLQAQLTFPAERLKLLIDTLDELAKASLSDGERASLETVRTGLEDALASALDTGASVEIASDSYFSEVDRLVFEYQALGLECIQFVAAGKEEGCAPPDDVREAVRDRVTAADVWLSDAQFDGRGAAIRRALGLSP